jgi:hypothetical protein
MAAMQEGIEAIAVCRVPFESTDEVELSLTPGDKILITRTEVGGGWLEGMLEGGDTCLSLALSRSLSLSHLCAVHTTPSCPRNPPFSLRTADLAVWWCCRVIDEEVFSLVLRSPAPTAFNPPSQSAHSL